MPKRPVYGVGINDSKDPVYLRVNGKQVRDKVYAVWQAMLGRCYGNPKINPRSKTYGGCLVDPRWYKFSAFKEWMEAQDYEGKHLDKDILKVGNKVYSPETCCFVTSDINQLAQTTHLNKQGFVGVYIWRDGRSKPYQAFSSCGKHKHLGMFGTIEEAFEVHVLEKVKRIREKAQEIKDLRIREGLLKHAVFWEEKIK